VTVLHAESALAQPVEVFGLKCSPANVSPITVGPVVCDNVQVHSSEGGNVSTFSGSICLDIVGMTGSCSGSFTVSKGETYSLTSTFKCSESMSLALGAAVTVTEAWTGPVQPCKRCSPRVCLDNAVLEIRKAIRHRARWRREPFDGSARCWTVTGWEEETHYVVSLSRGQVAPNMVMYCVDDSCYCKRSGYDGCHCDSGSDEAVSHEISSARLTDLESKVQFEDSVFYDLAQLRQADTTGIPIRQLGDLSRFELVMLRRIAETIGLDSSGRLVVLGLAGGEMVRIRPGQLANVVAKREAALLIGDAYKDVNQDGLINGQDLALIIQNIARSENAENTNLRADLNADGIIDGADVDMFLATAQD